MSLMDSLPIKHVARPPDRKSESPPLLLLLHGVGSHERDLFELAPELDPRFYILSLRGPFDVGPNQFAWYPLRFTPQGPDLDPAHTEQSRQKLIEFIDRAADHYQTDPSKVYLFGFSQGAIMSQILLLTNPAPIAGVVAVSGRMLPYLFQEDNPLGGNLAPKEDLQDIPLFLAHGRQDPVIPVSEGRRSEEIFSRTPVAMTYREYDMPHGIGPDCLREIQMWLEAQLSEPQ